MYDDWTLLHEQRMAEQREAERNAAQYHPQGGVVGLALLPFAAGIGALCGTLRLIAEQKAEKERIQAESQCLEARIMDATARAKEGQIIPMERILGVHERG